MRRLIQLVPFLFAVAATACDILGTDEPNVVFDSERVEVEDSTQSSAIFLTGDNVLGINGVMIAPNDCQGLRGSVQLGSGTVTITITARQVTTSCDTTRGGYAYRLTTSINGGIYQLKVIHNFSGAQAAETVLDTPVTVT